MDISRILLASLVSCFLTFVPGWLLKLPSDFGVVGQLKWAGSYVAIPGTFVGLIASGFQIDDISFVVADIGNFIFYLGLAYVVLSIWSRRRAVKRA
jgi:hypothetical protein